MEEQKQGNLFWGNSGRGLRSPALLGQPHDRCCWANLLPIWGPSKKHLLTSKRKQWKASDSRAGTTSNSFLHLLQPHLEPQTLWPNLTKPKVCKEEERGSFTPSPLPTFKLGQRRLASTRLKLKFAFKEVPPG